MSDSRQEILWGIKPQNLEGVQMTDRRRFSGIVSAICFTHVAVILLGVSAFGRAQEVTTDTVDLRQEVYELLTDMSSVRDGESWTRWVDQWNSVVRTQYNNANIDALALGQVVEVPQSPADWSYVDWEDVPYEVRPSVALAHACGLMNGRVYQDGSLAWDTDEDLKRYEAANIAARVAELIFEVVLNNAAYSRPGCPIAMEAYHGDPEVFKDLVERQAVRHDEAVAELEAAIARLEARPDLSDEVRALIRQDLDLRVEFQTEMASIVRDINARWDELKSEVNSLWIVLAEYDEALQTLRQEIFEEVWALCADGACKGEQGPQGPRGLVGPQGPQGPAGKDADVDGLRNEFNDMLADMRGDFVTHEEFEADQARQDAVLDDHEGRITNLENQGYIYADYCPLTVSFTGPNNESYNENYPGGEVSANISVDALAAALGGVITTYGLPEGGLVPEGSDMTFRKSAWYESLRRGAEITATMMDGRGATCSRSVTLGGY
jgi:hypothetical protein